MITIPVRIVQLVRLPVSRLAGGVDRVEPGKTPCMGWTIYPRVFVDIPCLSHVGSITPCLDATSVFNIKRQLSCSLRSATLINGQNTIW
jgi:hypothetical protein